MSLSQLAAQKSEALIKFIAKTRSVKIPPGIEVPSDPLEALKLGMRISKREAYAEGMLAGLDLGLEVCGYESTG